MRNIILLLSVFVFFACQAKEQSKAIRINSLGFITEQPKIGTIIKTCDSFLIKDIVSGETVFSGKVRGPVFQEDVNQKVWQADFSELKKPGEYILEVEGVGNSVKFKIASDSYNFAFKTSMRAFYLWRCGTAVEGDFKGQHFTHDACHLKDGFEDYVGNTGVQRDGTGGWHDAGDYGKYVANAGITVASMFLAWDHFQPKLEKINLDLPETAPGFPDFLKEIKWEMDWLFKMQYPDGSGKVSHKLTRTNFSGFIKAEDDNEKRYFTDWSTTATANFVGMMAMAARYFEPYDAEYAQRCLDAAWVSYRLLLTHPEQKRFEQGDFRTGHYESNDADDRIWAAAEMWETTGDKLALEDFEKRVTEYEFNVFENWDWQNISNLGVFTYALSEREGKNQEVQKQLVSNILEVANVLVEKSQQDIYGRPLGQRYYWGCNGTVARQVINLQVANLIQPQKTYEETSLNALSHLFGRNYYNRSYVTGLGLNPPMNPHSRRSGADDIKNPWPGYIVGGGQHATDWKDKQGSFQTNEIAINWQGALVYALAAFVNP